MTFVLYFFIKCFIFIFTTYLINFLIYLSIIFLTLHLYLYVDHIIALIVLYVLYFSYFLNCILCIYIYMDDVLSEIKKNFIIAFRVYGPHVASV